MRRIIEERGAKNILHVGARAYAKEELGFASEHQMSTITDEDIRSGSGPQMVSEFVLKHKSTYASFDLDVLDPAFAPGCCFYNNAAPNAGHQRAHSSLICSEKLGIFEWTAT